MPKTFAQQINPADHVAEYWNSAVTRKELQPIFDDYARVFQEFSIAHAKLDMVVGYLVEKFQIKIEDVQAYAAQKEAELKANLEAAAKEQAERLQAEGKPAAKSGIKLTDAD